jgi:hypothetical protein
MKKSLAQHQERMRERVTREAQKAEETVKRMPMQSVREFPRAAYKPVDYSKQVNYLTEDVELLHYWPRVCGVYLLFEDGRYYIGQSIDIPARYASHRLKPISCGFKDPRCAMLVRVPLREGWTWSQNAHTRLNAEARFLSSVADRDTANERLDRV